MGGKAGDTGGTKGTMADDEELEDDRADELEERADELDERALEDEALPADELDDELEELDALGVQPTYWYSWTRIGMPSSPCWTLSLAR